MKFLKAALSPSQIGSLLRKDVLVRRRQPWMSVVQVIWPCLMFMLLYLIRLKFGPEEKADCQFPTRMLPTKNNVLPGFYSYICSLENKCLSTKDYEEYSKYQNAPLKPVVDIVQIFINDDSLFNALIELPEKANFISAVTTLFTSGHLDEIRGNIEKVIAMVPQVEKMLNGGSFDIKKLFSNRQTFVMAGNLMCGHPFPSTESIPLVNDILESEDFSTINDDELKVMPTKYCKQLYVDVTSSNHGKLTWNTIKPIIHGKILYAPIDEQTNSIMQFSNVTFVEINRLKMLSVALEQILTKLRVDDKFIQSLDSLLKLVQSPFVRSIIGDDFDIDQVESVVQRIRTDPVIYDVIVTIKNILECFSVDRFMPLNTETELRKKAFELNNQRMFYAAIYFNKTETDVVYKFHMDTENTQPTFENKNRFWFPGPSGSMLRDMKYHRGFVQIKQALDLGIIKHKKKQLLESGILTEEPAPTTPSSFTVKIITDDDDEDEDDDEWFTNTDLKQPVNDTKSNSGLISGFVSGTNLSQLIQTPDINLNASTNDTSDDTDSITTILPQFADPSVVDEDVTTLPTNADDKDFLGASDLSDGSIHVNRQKRQGLFDLFSAFVGGNQSKIKYQVDNLQYFTKQFPYPAYTHDDFKTGLYLAQAIPVAFFLGLVAQIASCVRHRIWMRESRNTLIMRSMGLKPCSEITAWIIVTCVELLVIFLAVIVILYSGETLVYTKWLFILIFLFIFGFCLIAFCYMCSTFFTSATIGAVATALLFFISLCPYIIVLLFDAQLSSLQNFGINLSFTTAFSHAWSDIMRLELQETGMTFEAVFRDGLSGDFGFSLVMIILDMCIYIIIGNVRQHFKDDELQFIEVQRAGLDANVGATMTNVSKIYNDNKMALSNISLSFPKNQVTCLLGRNGAGKSTIIKLLTGQIVQTTGRVILSQNMASTTEYDKIGVCPQDNILIPNLTAREHLEMYARIKMKHGYKSEVENTLKSMNFGEYESYQASQLSGGYQRRLCVAIAFIASPNVVILDEPCNGVDTKARKDIWELIERLRKGRAVLFATHFLDEAEHLSDVIVIMKEGKVIAKHTRETLKNHCTASYEVSMQCWDSQTFIEIAKNAALLLTNAKVLEKTKSTDMRLEVSYNQPLNKSAEFLNYLQELQRSGRVYDLSVESQNLEQLFTNLNQNVPKSENGHAASVLKTVTLKSDSDILDVRKKPLTPCESARQLFWKRLVHFRRNYRMLLCVIVLPAIFELLAMWFVAYRLEDDYDTVISLTRNLYPKSTQLMSKEISTNFTNNVYDSLQQECMADMPCKEFGNSKDAFYWILETMPDYHEKRYGGYTFNDSKTMVWYNNKGYHAMMGWLNDLNTHLMQVELNDTDYSITSYNEPWKLGFAELSTSSILRQAGDSCMAFILLIAYSLVVAVASVYLVNERMKGEKLQQKLCGVNTATYWAVSFMWDFLIIILAVMVCTTIMLCFGMPVFVARQQIWGIIVLALFFGFACIPAVHVFEKCFTDSSVAIVTIFCMNVIIPLFTMAIIVLLGVVGDSAAWDDWRYFLNRAFLIFPQHALGDGLLELCKNYMVALVFRRYDIDSYKNPVNSDLLKPHYIALGVLGCFFIILNVLLESGLIYKWREALRMRFFWPYENEKKHLEELKIVSIQNSLKRDDKYESPQILKVDNLSKCYKSGQYAVKNVTFAVKSGECFGLLGKNGAGKSTIFKMLSGQLHQNSGDINYFDCEVSYCPQTNTLDSLLTVTECIEFYGKLRRIQNIPKLVENILRFYQLEPYRNVLVKNLSGGNRRKLTVATSCCGKTSIVLMDEPTSDMDPVTRAIVYRAIQDLLAQQRGIVLTSHSISEIDEICHRIAVLKNGQILTCSSPESLKAQYGGFYNVTIFCDQAKISDIEKALRERLPQVADFQTYSYFIKFNTKIDNPIENSKLRESGIDVPPDYTFTLAELFDLLSTLSEEYSQHSLRYAVNRCRLDSVFERILDQSEKGLFVSDPTRLTKSTFIGSPSTGYIHNGYVETEIAA